MKKLYKTMTIRHEGMNITSPNTVLEPEQGNFHISYNDRDTAAYGDVTTALVIDSNQFLILNGDHRSAYAALVQNGLDGVSSRKGKYSTLRVFNVPSRSELSKRTL